MKISKIRAWKVDLPLKEGKYAWADGKFVEVFDSTIVEIETDEGISGFGECCPLGPVYLPSYAPGVRTGIATIAPHLIGADPTNINHVNQVMDSVLRGHPYVKSPLDVALWDIVGQVTDRPLHALLGGQLQPSVALYRAISQGTPEEMAVSVRKYLDEGYRRFQLKVGGNPDDDIERIAAVRDSLPGDCVLVADANGGWTRAQAARVVDAVKDLDIFVEQPCAAYDECLSIRRRTTRPFILDEVITDAADLIRAISNDAMDVINLKISRVGGLTKARILRDICIEAGIAMTIEDSWGGDVATAAIAHLALSTPSRVYFSATDFNSYCDMEISPNAPDRVGGMMSVSERPGLGIVPLAASHARPALQIGS